MSQVHTETEKCPEIANLPCLTFASGYSKPLRTEQLLQLTMERILEKERSTVRSLWFKCIFSNPNYWDSLQGKRLEKIVQTAIPGIGLTRKEIVQHALFYFNLN